jgi:hypothetical protein
MSQPSRGGHTMACWVLELHREESDLVKGGGGNGWLVMALKTETEGSRKGTAWCSIKAGAMNSV